jgi:hypothetical protein
VFLTEGHRDAPRQEVHAKLTVTALFATSKDKKKVNEVHL